MKLKNLSLAVLAGSLMLAMAPASAHNVVVHGYYYNDDDDDHEDDWKERPGHYDEDDDDDDDDEDEWKERYGYGKDEKSKGGKDYRYYYYERPPVVIYPYRSLPGRVDRDPPPPPPAGQKPSAKLQPSFPRESSADRALAKERQRDILERELASERQLSAKAKEQLAQEARRLGGETTDSYVLERLQLSKDNVETHEQNIQALQRELENLAR